jgi:2-methylcitrate dehydratase PrpD
VGESDQGSGHQVIAAPSHGETLVDFAATLTGRSVPPRVLKQAGDCLLDSVGCGLFGAKQPWGEMMAANTLEECAPGASSLFGRRERVAPAPAALVNGTAIHGYELDDLIVGAVVHPGAVVVPAALAAAEHANAPGIRLLLAVVAGYEAMARVALALGPEPSQRGFHVTAVVGPVAAALAAGVAMGLNREQLLAAVGLACSASSGIKSFAGGSGGGMVKRMHAGRSAEAGVRMAQLAARGYTGPRAALDGRFGLLEVFGGQGADASRLTQGLGERWTTDDIWVKVYPMCGGIHSAAQALRRLRGDRALAPDDIQTVRVGVSAFAARNNGERDPSDTMGAQYSIPYCAAVALLGDPLDPAMFAESALGTPALRSVATKVSLHVDDEAEKLYPRRLAARVELTLKGGATATASVVDAHGTPSDPCTDGERRERFARLASAAVRPPASEAMLHAAERLAAAPSVRAFTQLMH